MTIATDAYEGAAGNSTNEAGKYGRQLRQIVLSENTRPREEAGTFSHTVRAVKSNISNNLYHSRLKFLATELIQNTVVSPSEDLLELAGATIFPLWADIWH